MTHRLCTLLLVSLLLSAATTAAQARARMFRIDTVHSQVLFSVDHNSYSRPVGRLHIQGGWLRFDPDDWSASATEITLDATSVDMGNAKWSQVVCEHQFLDCKDYALAHFHSTSVTRTNKHSGMLHGVLDMRGHQLPVDIAFTLNRLGATIFEMHTVAGFSARSALDRTRLGMTSHTGSIGRNVKIRLEVEAIADSSARRDYQSAQTDTHKAKHP
ncbi:YceI family protein [Oleiagrimonas sp. C23AA]|uniref:YceI family protein n=1 Tax=Oleiagrimonas sp. C23AA TaxID=2719047 RepID=UPI00141E6329|nr:YceI family protein [Oleiagrimonas sp. C23AA]NII12085.1 YceI family protein [Oleiagrimonas sp. C23AA]